MRLIESHISTCDFVFERGQTYLIEASSGAGKSSLCSFIVGHRHDYEGQILFDSRDIRTFSVADWTKIRQKELSLMYQDLRLFPELTAMENVEIKNQLTHFKTRKEIEDLFDALGIADKISAKIGRMSYGQQQRVAFIRALAQPFDFLIADEPISHLDDDNGKVMGEIMMDEIKRQGAGLIVTSIGKYPPLPFTNFYKI